LLLIKSRDPGFRQVSRVSLPAQVFQINEPIFFGLPIVLHNAGGPIAHAANLHLAANLPNLFELETVRAFYRTYFRELTDVTTEVVDGCVALPPDRPGLGVALNPDLWQRDDLHVLTSEGEGKAVNLQALGDSWSRPDIRL
ncbi:MAG: hypothetical protein HC802_21665, partial [Caldilineaceae bacterium]|nr:hypothetical protein [Caldilineaceae bacterium]